MRRDVEIFDATVTISVTVDPWIASTGGKGTAIGYLFLDIGGVGLVDD